MPRQLAGGDAGNRVEQRLEEHVEVALEELLANTFAHGRQLTSGRQGGLVGWTLTLYVIRHREHQGVGRRVEETDVLTVPRMVREKNPKSKTQQILRVIPEDSLDQACRKNKSRVPNHAIGDVVNFTVGTKSERETGHKDTGTGASGDPAGFTQTNLFPDGFP